MLGYLLEALHYAAYFKGLSAMKVVQRGDSSLGHMPGIARIANEDSNSPKLAILQPERTPAQRKLQREHSNGSKSPPHRCDMQIATLRTAMREVRGPKATV